MTLEKILEGESRNLEFKVQRPNDSTKYMKSVVAFANGEGGRIIFGIDDKTHQVVGIPKELVFSEMDAITSAISDSCEPVIIPDVYLQQIDDKAVIVVEISQGRQRPYYIKAAGIKDGTYIRVAGTSRPADRDLAAEMYYEDERRSYDNVVRRDLTVTDEEIRSLCKQMKEVAVRNARSEDQKTSVRDVTKNHLLSWGLLEEGEDGKIHPTNGYVFLLGLDPFHSMIQCGVFKGTTRGVFIDKREYTGPLWEQVEQAHDFALRNIHLGARLIGIYRQDIYELPPDSIREIIINAVMNCSFLQNSHIQLAIYDDRLEITSPGGLLPGVTVKKMREGYSKIRNKALAHAFLYMNMIEEWGSGVPKIVREMEEYGLQEPEFIDMEIGFRINLYRYQDLATNQETNQKTGTTDQETNQEIENTSQETDQEIIQKATDTEQKTCQKKDLVSEMSNMDKIRNAIAENPYVTQRELQKITGLSRSGVRYILQHMRDSGELERVGATKKGKWMLK